MRPENLKPHAQAEMLRKIGDYIQKIPDYYDEDSIEIILVAFVSTIADLDNDDFFGTEGWQSAFGIDD